MNSKPVRLTLSLICCAWISVGYAATLRELTATPVCTDIKISPTGEFLAIRIFQEGKHHINFVSRETSEILGRISFRRSREVGNYHWVNDERVVVEVLDAASGKEAPEYFGELFAANFDGTQGELIFGYRSGESQIGARIRKKDADYAWAEIIDVLPDNKKRILIASVAMSRKQDKRAKAVQLDVYSGLEKKQIMWSPFPQGRFYTDKTGTVRLVTSRSADSSIHIQGLPDGAEEWVDIGETNYGTYFTPIAISDDKKSVYVLDNIEDDKVGLYKLSLAGDSYRKLYTHKSVDITNLVMTADDRSVIAIRIDDGYPSYLLLSNPGEEAKTFKLLLKHFSGSTVSIRSRSRDGRYWVVRTGTDVDPGSYHLYDREEKTLGKLFDSRPDVKSEDLAAMEPIEFKSFDERSIAGYFTPAKNVAEKVVPLVVLVHGGPHLRDYWGYDADVQALATNGFSVLQINFRGSTGYGYEFESSGYRQWGNEIQKDIIAGTRWAIEEQRADAGNICIMGASFGAYSAVQSATLAPELYNCVVANAGLYDLPLMYRKGDIESLYLGDEYLERTIGRDDDELKRYSPVNRVALLEQPIFIAHGKMDDRAPFEHAKRLRKALDQNGKQYESFVKRREAHGFYDNDNQVEYLQGAIAFLKKHLTVARNPLDRED